MVAVVDVVMVVVMLRCWCRGSGVVMVVWCSDGGGIVMVVWGSDGVV